MKYLLLLWALPYCSICQVATFQKNYNIADYNSTDNGIDIISDDSNLLMNGLLTCVFGNSQVGCDGLIKTDQAGNLLWKKIYHNYPYKLQILESKPWQGSGYLSCGSSYSPNGYKPMLMRLDENGDTLWLKYYDDIDKDHALHLETMPGGKVLVFGNGNASQQFNHRHFFIMKTDSLGNVEWETIPAINTPQTLGGDFALLPGGGMAIAHRNSPPDSFDETLALTKTDSLGNVLWSEEYLTNGDNYCDARMRPLADGGFAISYCTEDWSEGWLWMDIYKMDSMGVIEWQFTFPKQILLIAAINTTANGDIIGCGYKVLDPLVGGSHGWLFRISPAGELRWQRAYLPDAPSEIHQIASFADLTETPDGGIAATGIMDDSLDNSVNADVWLLKVDGDGCFTPGCTDTVLTVSLERRGGVVEASRQVFFRVSPNPVGGQAEVAFLAEVPPGARLRVFSGQGTQVLETKPAPGKQSAQLDFSNLPPGLYSIVYEAGGRILQTEKILKF